MLIWLVDYGGTAESTAIVYVYKYTEKSTAFAADLWDPRTGCLDVAFAWMLVFVFDWWNIWHEICWTLGPEPWAACGPCVCLWRPSRTLGSLWRPSGPTLKEDKMTRLHDSSALAT